MSEKSKLENTWTVIQIFAVIIGGYWGVTQWQHSDYQKLAPRVVESIEDLNAIWLAEDNAVCSIGAQWVLDNKGELPVKVSNISYDVLYVPNKKSQLVSGKYEDASLGKLVSESAKKIAEDIELQPSDDFIIAGGKLSRDILFRYKPAVSDAKKWFKENRITFFVKADLETNKGWLPCPLCEKAVYSTEIYSSLKWYCKS